MRSLRDFADVEMHPETCVVCGQACESVYLCADRRFIVCMECDENGEHGKYLKRHAELSKKDLGKNSKKPDGGESKIII